ncbi:hypothetical protein PYW08_016180 [Mythimna loreyi]|uniref:Uncharacterized protein n=1 Tax=Mythimna loreyi TaxID=667449 RepID=A0ACC2QV07_9NEOP|nr:hypothetical protein PYW08_016180 [Mythimna loreyi]
MIFFSYLHREFIFFFLLEARSNNSSSSSESEPFDILKCTECGYRYDTHNAIIKQFEGGPPLNCFLTAHVSGVTSTAAQPPRSAQVLRLSRFWCPEAFLSSALPWCDMMT